MSNSIIHTMIMTTSELNMFLLIMRNLSTTKGIISLQRWSFYIAQYMK